MQIPIKLTPGKFKCSDNFSILLSSLIILLGCICWKTLHNIGDNIPSFLLSAGVMFLAYAFCVYGVIGSESSKNLTKEKTYHLRYIILFSLIFRLLLVSVLPSDDIYRYLWEGKILGAGISPYRYPPESNILLSFRDAFYPLINHKNFSSIYPPLSQYVFTAADFFSHSITSMKLAFISFDFMTILVVCKILKGRGMNVKRVVIYAYNPLVLLSVAAHGHNDSLFVFLLMASILAFEKRKWVTSNILLAASFLSKFIFIFFWPIYIKKSKKYALYFILTVLLLSIPLYSTIPSLFDVLFRFGKNFRFNDSIHIIFYGFFRIFFERKDALLSAKIISIIILSFFYIYFACKNEDLIKFGFYFTGLLLLMLPTVHPWYILWIIPFLVFFPNRAWILLTGTMFFYFVILGDFNTHHVWRENQWMHALIYLPFYFFLIKDGDITSHLKKPFAFLRRIFCLRSSV